MNFRSLRTPLLCLSLVVTTLVALRTADEKAKPKDDQADQPGVVKFATAPAAVQKTYKDETKNAKIELLGKGQNGDQVFYRAIVGVGTNDYDIAVAENGQVLEKLMHPARVDAKFEECPPAVQKALKEEIKGAKVESVVRVTAGKRADYIMDITVQKIKYQAIFTEDGTLMSKVFDDGAESEDPTPPAPKEPEKKEPPKQAKKPK